jgi:hypothetical protein
MKMVIGMGMREVWEGMGKGMGGKVGTGRGRHLLIVSSLRVSKGRLGPCVSLIEEVLKDFSFLFFVSTPFFCCVLCYSKLNDNDVVR